MNHACLTLSSHSHPRTFISQVPVNLSHSCKITSASLSSFTNPTSWIQITPTVSGSPLTPWSMVARWHSNGTWQMLPRDLEMVACRTRSGGSSYLVSGSARCVHSPKIIQGPRSLSNNSARSSTVCLKCTSACSCACATFPTCHPRPPDKPIPKTKTKSRA